MNNKVKFLRGTATEYEAKTKDNDTFYYTTDTKKLYLGEIEITGIEIDDTSTTATDKTWSAKKISDNIPTELPANGGNADTVGNYPISTNGAKGIVVIPSDYGTVELGQRLDFHSVGSQDFAVRVYVSPPNWDAGTTQPRLRVAKPDGSTADIADGGNAATVGGAAVVTSTALGLHRLASGTDEATTANCPVGCWYGKYSG